jgi:hypothetical protein
MLLSFSIAELILSSINKSVCLGIRGVRIYVVWVAFFDRYALDQSPGPRRGCRRHSIHQAC